MLNFEKYEEEIKKEIANFRDIPCIVKDLKDGGCGESRNCVTCSMEMLHWLSQEYKEPILTDKEKGYLKNVIEPLGVEVRYIKKWKSIYIEENKCCYNIAITVKHPIMETWERDLMNFAVTKEMPFKRLELDKRYSLKDLGL